MATRYCYVALVSLLGLILATGLASAQEVIWKEDYATDTPRGVGWTFWGGGKYVVVDGLLQAGNNDGNPDWFAITGDPAWSDVIVEVVVGVPAKHNTGDIRVLARVQDEENYYEVRLIYGNHATGKAYAGLPPTGDGVLWLVKTVDGKPVLLAETRKDVPMINGNGDLAGQFIGLRFEVKGTSLRVLVDRMDGTGWREMLSATDDTFRTGRIGIGQGEYWPAFKSIAVLKP